jgi:hypothetical protein
MLSLTGTASFAQSTGTVQGIASSDDGKPISAASIIATRTSPATPVVSLSSVSARDGAFTIASLPAGTYRLCIQVRASEYLDPCIWSSEQTTVTLAEGQVRADLRPQAARRSFMCVRINDPNKRLKRDARSGKSAPLLLGVWTPSKLFIPMAMNAEDEAGRNFQVLVPLDADLWLSVASVASRLVRS